MFWIVLLLTSVGKVPVLSQVRIGLYDAQGGVNIRFLKKEEGAERGSKIATGVRFLVNKEEGVSTGFKGKQQEGGGTDTHHR